MKLNRKLRMGMVGGGRGAFIGAVHRMAARLDGHYDFCAGALSSDPERARASGRELGLTDDRSYAGFEDLLEGESARADGVEAVAIVTPNHMHFPVAKACLEAGIHVICDKPMTVTVDEARTLRTLAESHGRILAVTYNYSGYPLVREAREMVRRGDLGNVRVVQGEYAQDWLSRDIESGGQKQASWRTDPGRSGAGGCIGDIGTHIYQLISFVTGLETQALSAELATFVEGRRLDDNAHLLLRFRGGAGTFREHSRSSPMGLRLTCPGPLRTLRCRNDARCRAQPFRGSSTASCIRLGFVAILMLCINPHR